MKLNHSKSYPTYREDMRALDNLANAYNNCNDNFRDTWKQKWYEMCSLIAKRVQDWEVTLNNLEKKKQRKKWGEDKD